MPMPPATPEQLAVIRVAVMLREDNKDMLISEAVDKAREMVSNDPSLIEEGQE